MSHVRPRSFLAWSATLTIVACNALWGIDDGKLAEPDTGLTGAGAADVGGAPSDAAGTSPAHGGDGGDPAGGAGGAGPAVAGEGGAGGEPMSTGGTGGGVAGGGNGGVAGGGMSGMSGSGGTPPTCSGCKLGEQKSESAACGNCGTGTKTHTATCDANCTWGAWSAWSVCSQCDGKRFRCCDGGKKWEWCYDSDCAWTNDCEACSATSCPECY